ncbi:MAG: hypothetical protein Q9222_002708 [Ikaeria aurantiellina]
MPLSKKIGLIFVFLIGYLSIGIAQAAGKHVTALSNIWSILEPSFALVGACIPTLAFLVRRYYEILCRSFSSLRSRYSGASRSLRSRSSRGLLRAARRISPNEDTQDIRDQKNSSEESANSLERASTASSTAKALKRAEPSQVYDGPTDLEAGSAPDERVLNPHRNLV